MGAKYLKIKEYPSGFTEVIKIQKNEKEELVVKESKKGKVVKYSLYAAIIVAFVVGILVANYFNTQANERVTLEQKNTVDNLKSENQRLTEEKESALALVSAEKGTLAAENANLETENAALTADIALLDGLLSSLSGEKKETASEPYYKYDMTWQKYILTKPGQAPTTQVSIENTGTSSKTYSLDVQLRSSYKDALTKTPADGSLTLEAGSSGNINLKFEPEKEGYAIYGLYINGRHSGDIIVLVRAD
ncbi:MAG: hypothetical protein ABIE94_02980 [archaeon]